MSDCPDPFAEFPAWRDDPPQSGYSPCDGCGNYEGGARTDVRRNRFELPLLLESAAPQPESL